MAMERPAANVGDDVRPAALGAGLVIELDRQQARAVLFSSVEGQGRFVAASTAPSTALPPIDDAAVAVKQALRDIELQTGLTLVGPDGVQLPAHDDMGVTYLAITGQPAPPVRLTILAVGASPVADALHAAARRAIAVVDVLGAGVRSVEGVLSGALLEQQLRAFRPDAVVLVEGTAVDAEWSTATGTLAALVNDGALQQIIIVAREQHQHVAAQVFGEHADLRGIDPSEFATAEIAAALEVELNTLYEARIDARGALGSSSPAPFVSLIRAGDLVTRFAARRRGQTVVSVAAGDGAVIHRAAPDGGETTVRPDLDVTHNIRGALALDPRLIANWLPFAMSAEDITHWILNRGLRPFSVVESPRDVVIESAVLTACLRDAWAGGPDAPADLIIGGRPVSAWRSAALGVFALLNAVQPRPASGLLDVILDRDGLLPAAGAIGEQSPALAADAVELDLLHPTASVVVVAGAGSEGDLAVRGQLRRAGGETVRFTVPYGSLHHLPLAPGHEATLTLSCEPRFTIGGHASADEVTFGDTTPLRGSELGIVIDARGRPLQPANDPTLQATRVATWLEDLGVRV